MPAGDVKERFRRLEQEHIEYILDALRKNTSKIRNIRGYLLASLYNAPVTIGPYYQAEVQHDLYCFITFPVSSNRRKHSGDTGCWP